MSIKKFLYNVLVSFLIIVLVGVNFIFLLQQSVQAVYASLEQQEAKIYDNNLIWDAYFKEEDNQVYTKTKKTSETETLYLNIDLKNTAILSNGRIELKNSNFSIIEEEINHPYVKQFDKEQNIILLNDIDGGSNIEIPISIKFNKKEQFEVDYFSKESTLNIYGDYKASEDAKKENTVNLDINVRINWTDEAQVFLSQEISKYIKLEDNKFLVEQEISAEISNDVLPRKSETVNINIPFLDENTLKDIKILKNGKLLDEKDYTLDIENGQLKIQNSIEISTEQMVNWEDSVCEYSIIYIYEGEIKEEINSDIEINTITDFYGQDEAVENKLSEQVQSIIKGDLISLEGMATQEIYKGYFYTDDDEKLEFQEEYNLEISDTELINDLKVEMGEMYFENDDQDEVEANNISTYQESIFSKDEIFLILGQEGKIEIYNQDGNKITEITDETETDEQGNIIISYPENVYKIQLNITKPQSVGKITILNKKQIGSIANISYENIKSFTKLNNKASVTSNVNISDIVIETKLLEPTETVEVVIGQEELLTAKQNKNVEIKAILKTQNEKQKLFKNPILKIKLPSQIEEIQVNSIKLLYEDELTITKAYLKDNTIELYMSGEQTKYKEELVEGATVIIDADLTLNKKELSAQEKIILEYQNQQKNGKYITNNVETNVKVTSPQNIITTNDIEEYGIQTIGDGKQVAELQKSVDEKNVRIDMEIINTKSSVKDVSVLGRFPTQGEFKSEEVENDNTIKIKILEKISLEAENNNYQIYYSENANATEELENLENGWTTEITNSELVKSYLIKVNDLAQGQVLKASYPIQIPSGLEYNESAYENYVVKYTDAETNVEYQVESDVVGLETGNGPVVEATTVAYVQGNAVSNNAEIKAGEVICYKTVVKNTGTEEATNIVIDSQIPEGTVFVQRKENSEYTGTLYYDEIEKENHQETIESLAPGESKEIKFEVRVKMDLEQQKNVSSTTKIKYGEIEKEIATIDNILIPSSIRLTLKRMTDRSIDMTIDNPVAYMAIIENVADEETSDIYFDFELPENLEVKSTYYVDGYVNSGADEENIDSTKELQFVNGMNVGKIAANSNKIIVFNIATTSMKEIEQDITLSASITSNGQKYRSNELEDTIKGYEITAQMTSTKNGETVKPGDIIEYVISIKSTSTFTLPVIEINDKLPDAVTIKSVLLDNKEQQIEDGKEVKLFVSLEPEQTVVIKIQVVVDYLESRDEPEIITNKAEVKYLANVVAETEEINIIIEANEKESSEDPSNPEEPENPSEPSNPENPDDGEGTDGIEEEKYLISGVVWIDSNEDGKKESGEALLAGVNVYLIDVATGKVVIDENGNLIEAVTNEKGIYLFDKVIKGRYIVAFEYDTSKYRLTQYQKEGISASENSDVVVKELDFSGQSKKYAVTDFIDVTDTSISNVSMGLIILKEFNLKLDKSIEKIIVKTNKESSVYAYDEAKLAKIELDKKVINQTTIEIQYSISVTNIGEVEGYAKKIADYIPSGVVFDEDVNKDWYKSGNYIYTESLSNTKIQCGETQKLTLILTKKMSSENVGTITNLAEIVEDYNDFAISDKNSVPNNQVQGEDDFGKAQLIVAVKTGGVTSYIMIFVILLMIMIAIFIIIKIRRVNKDRGE